MKNPFLNAFLAALYIVGIVFCVNSFASLVDGPDETLVIPIVLLSLLVLSVATMAFLFFYEPLRLLIEHQHRDATLFFGKTLGTFALIVGVFVLVLFL